MKTFKFSLVLRTRENTDVFITLDDNIYGIHIKRVNILYILSSVMKTSVFSRVRSTSENLTVFITRDENFLYSWKKRKCSFYVIVYTPMRVSDVITYVTKQNMNVRALTFSA